MHSVRRQALGTQTQCYACIHRSRKPWQNGFAESFVGTYRREVLNAEVFFSLEEAHILSNSWLHMYNTQRPHSKHKYRPPSTAFNKKAA
ncbi:MAG: transposase [Bradyrhizobiaceae bacterium]|nr:transposase [Bradyrhizobiaceae bacterium]